MPRNKSLAAWLALLGGSLGLHRFYLFGWTDRLGWLLPVPTLMGGYGLLRARAIGLDDHLAWLLLPLLGLTLAGCALHAIVLGLTAQAQWNTRFNPQSAPDHPAGATGWLTIGAVVAALLLGATMLLSSLAFGFQHYFEYQMAATRPATR